jgi:hypothetical protein
VKPVDTKEFEAVRRSMLLAFGRMTSRAARGFIIDLQNAIEDAGLDPTTVKWRGGDDALFTATGYFGETPSAWAALMLVALDDLAYADGGIATVDVSSDSVRVQFATWAPTIGLATVRMDAQPRSPGVIHAR